MVLHGLRAGVLAFAIFLSSQLAAAQTAFVTNVFSAPVRNNYSGYVGMKFTVGATPLYVTQLARYSQGGTTQSHVVKLVDAATGADIANGSTSVQAFSFGFVYAALPATVTLSANTSYLLVSEESAGGDSWYDYTAVSVTGAASVAAAVYRDAAGNYIAVAGSAGRCYVPVNFSYSTSAPAPLVTLTTPSNGGVVTGATATFSATVTASPGLTITGVQFQLGDGKYGNLVNLGPVLTQPPYTQQTNSMNLTGGKHSVVVTATDSAGKTGGASAIFFVAAPGENLITGFSGTFTRNNYRGQVGLAFSVGASPLTVTALGRVGLPTNNEYHQLSLVNAQTNVPVTGGSVNVLTQPGDGKTFQYAALTSPVTLAAQTSYYLVSWEYNGEDLWYDYSPVTGGIGGVTIDAAVYTDSGGNYVKVPNTANSSYGPVNLILASPAGSPTGTVTLTAPANNSVFTHGDITFSATATAQPGLSIANVAFAILDNFGLPSPIAAGGTTPPYTAAFDSALLAGTRPMVVAVATDSAGNTLVSAPVSIVVADDQLPFIGFTYNVLGPTGGPVPAGKMFGMQFTVGPKPLKVSLLGFFACCSFQSTTFPLKVVDAATGMDVPGTSFWVTSQGQGYGYGSVRPAVTLQANKSYYFLRESNYGGTYLLGPAVMAGAGTVDFPVSQAADGTYVKAPSLAGYSYAPLNFEYESPTAVPPSIAIVAPAANSTVAGTSPVRFSYGAAPPLSVASVQLRVDGANVGGPNPGSTTSLDTTAFSNGAHVLSAVATDSNGAQNVSAGVTVTVANQGLVQPPSPAFVTSFSPTFPRNNYTGFLGYRFTVGAGPIQVSSLGRVCLAGNSGTHAVKLVQVSNGADVSGGSATVAPSGCTAGQFVYAALASPLTLAAGSAYYLVDQETFGGDQWYDYAPLTVASGATVNGPVYANGNQWVQVNAPGYGYVPLNFLYSATAGGGNAGFSVTYAPTATPNATLGATVTSSLPVTGVQFQIDGYAYGTALNAAPYVINLVPALNEGNHVITVVAHDSAGNTVTSTPVVASFGLPLNTFNGGLIDVMSVTPGTLRNNYTGWVGMRLTTGSTASLVSGPLVSAFPYSSIGRLCASGNSMLHLLKLVRASDGTDVPNASGWINMAGCSAGAVVDAQLPSNVVLAANTSYYLVSREVAGGDLWFDISPAVPLASVKAPVDPIFALEGYVANPVGANFIIDGPVYSAANGSFVFLPMGNMSYVGLTVGGYSLISCQFGGVCGP